VRSLRSQDAATQNIAGIKPFVVAIAPVADLAGGDRHRDRVVLGGGVGGGDGVGGGAGEVVGHSTGRTDCCPARGEGRHQGGDVDSVGDGQGDGVIGLVDGGDGAGRGRDVGDGLGRAGSRHGFEPEPLAPDAVAGGVPGADLPGKTDVLGQRLAALPRALGDAGLLAQQLAALVDADLVPGGAGRLAPLEGRLGAGE